MDQVVDWMIDAALLGQGIIVLAITYIVLPILLCMGIKHVIGPKRHK